MDLLDLLECVRMKGVYPGVIIIHLGSNDFDVDTQMGMHHRTKYATDACRQMILHCRSKKGGKSPQKGQLIHHQTCFETSNIYSLWMWTTSI